ncbi:hypothetical protein [Rhizorhapis suberifaciens]|uniref:Uncharacterized protein n=1 Tax=Rhizorhapis suberifaciens TaxID=13656 RepID=A0A840HVF7_9SPHN|nr:hypothetical protein [Rhizorhapis suberifaciens]MBB4641943.1 hypothetical protein [Rhizorhapis suberifaciens]
MAISRRSRNLLIAGIATIALAIPAIGQDAPESLLPPGFGEAVPPDEGAPPAVTPAPAPGKRPGEKPTEDETASLPELLLTPGEEGEGDEDEEVENVELARQKYDLPPYARRSMDRIGVLTPRTKGLAPDAFGRAGGHYLGILMQKTRAPIASRWASILLRRALLSSTNTPAGVNGADWIADRAWLLLRMGEADAARMLVQTVDSLDYTPRLYAIAMQTYLATADPAGLCPLVAPALRTSDEPGWEMSQAICASLSGDQGLASAVLNQAERRGTARGIDFRLAEKVVGAGFNSRRSVNIEWEGVDQLTVWRYGMATATGIEIPDRLWAGVSPHVQAWKARAALLPLASRINAVNVAARLGVFSNAAVVDFQSRLAEDEDAPEDIVENARRLRDAYTGDAAQRLDIMRSFWTPNGNGADYAGYVAMARAAARLPITTDVGDDIAPLIASMLAGGFDRNAAAWSNVVGQIDGQPAQDAWALLALASPELRVGSDYDRIDAYRDQDGSANFIKSRMLVAGLAGLGRMSLADMNRIAPDIGLRAGYRSRWTRAIDEAARRGEPGTVAVLAGVGMQVSDWSRLPPEHLFHIVSALRRVGLEPEARMIAAEAIARL